jgi:hypothetical protein
VKRSEFVETLQRFRPRLALTNIRNRA